MKISIFPLLAAIIVASSVFVPAAQADIGVANGDYVEVLSQPIGCTASTLPADHKYQYLGTGITGQLSEVGIKVSNPAPTFYGKAVGVKIYERDTASNDFTVITSSPPVWQQGHNFDSSQNINNYNGFVAFNNPDFGLSYEFLPTKHYYLVPQFYTSDLGGICQNSYLYGTADSVSYRYGEYNDDLNIKDIFFDLQGLSRTFPATLIVKSVVINDNEGSRVPGEFLFMINNGEPYIPEADGENAVGMDVGPYEVSGYLYGDYIMDVSGDCSGTIAAGETKTCTITNDDVYVPTQPTYETTVPSAPSPKGLVVITHGFNADAGGWVEDMKNDIKNSVNASEWTVISYDWSQDAAFLDFLGLNARTPWGVLSAAAAHGRGLGKQIAASGRYEKVHFIGHSAGSNLIQAAVTELRTQLTKAGKPQPVIHATFLDAYAPDGLEKEYGACTTYAEQYVDGRGSPILKSTNLSLDHATNIDVTSADPDQQVPFSLTRVHHWPVAWYEESVKTPGSSSYGYALSLEHGSTALPPLPAYCPALDVLKSINFESDVVHGLDSPTGTIAISGPTSAILSTGSPVWFETRIMTEVNVNALNFHYEFLSAAGAQGILTVFLDDKPVATIDERIADPGVNDATNILLGDIPPGEHFLRFRLDPFTDVQSVVRITDVELGLLTQQEAPDILAPTTTASGSGLSGNNGWYIGSATIKLSAVDNPGGIGVKDTHYSLDGGPWQTYSATGSIVISAEAIHTLQYYSTDVAGNQEATKTLTVKIDKTAPEGKITFDPVTKKLIVIGSDNLSPVTVEMNATSALLTDEAGHTLKILFSIFRQQGKLATARVTGLAYDGVSVKLHPISRLHFAWSEKNNAITDLNERATITRRQHADGNYNAKKNTTVIRNQTPVTDSDEDREPDDRKSKKETFPGLRILWLSTAKGVVSIGY